MGYCLWVMAFGSSPLGHRIWVLQCMGRRKPWTIGTKQRSERYIITLLNLPGPQTYTQRQTERTSLSPCEPVMAGKVCPTPAAASPGRPLYEDCGPCSDPILWCRFPLTVLDIIKAVPILSPLGWPRFPTVFLPVPCIVTASVTTTSVVPFPRKSKRRCTKCPCFASLYVDHFCSCTLLVVPVCGDGDSLIAVAAPCPDACPASNASHEIKE